MNKHILLVMKWLNDKDSVSQEELKENKHGVHAAYATGGYAYACTAYATHACTAYAAAAYAEYWVKEYFEETGEDKNEYLKELEQ